MSNEKKKEVFVGYRVDGPWTQIQISTEKLKSSQSVRLAEQNLEDNGELLWWILFFGSIFQPHFERC
jgi:hypothetical protein